jgi:hypothetical protein
LHCPEHLQRNTVPFKIINNWTMANPGDIVAGGAISRHVARPLNTVFHGIFTESNLTKIQKIKQFVLCIVYASGKRVGRMARMAEQQLCQEMNKAYYMHLQVLFADIQDGRSYWQKHLGFNFSFADMMTQTFGSGQVQRTFYFDYNSNENLEDGQVDHLKLGWINPFLWRRYGELKTEMQSSMLPVLMKCRIRALDGGASYETGSGASFPEVLYEFLGKLFQIDANAKHEERVRKRGRVADAAGGQPAPANVAAENPAIAAAEEENNEGLAPVASAPAAGRSIVRDAPDRWGDAHVAWRHSCLFVFVLNGPLTYFHPDIGSRTVCEFLRKVPRSGPPNAGAAARRVEDGDSRRQQRRHDERDAGISRAESDNRNFIEEIAQSRMAQERATREGNELARLQLQVQIAGMQQRQQNGQEHMTRIQNLRAAIEMLNKLPDGMELSETQKQQKKDMEQRYAEALIAVGQVQELHEDPLANLASAIAHATQPYIPSPAGGVAGQLPGASAILAPDTVPRARPSAAAGRPLHPSYRGSAGDRQQLGAVEDSVENS